MPETYSPGPWVFDDGMGRRGGTECIRDANGQEIITGACFGESCIPEIRFRNEADLRLIVAAPDLLAALKELRYWRAAAHSNGDHTGGTLFYSRDHRESLGRAIEAADAAIAAAEGETNE